MPTVRRCAPLLAIAACLSMSVAANEGAPVGAERFQVVFQRGAKSVVSEGAQGVANAAALARIADVFKRVGSLKSVQFVFVARRPVCESDLACDAHPLAVDRQQAILRQAALTNGHLQQAGLAFADELSMPVKIAATPADWEGMTLFLDRGPTVPQAVCNAEVRLRDPDLPARIAGDSAVVLGSQEHAIVAPEALLAIIPQSGQTVHVVWRDSNHRFGRGAADKSFHPVPRGATMLYLIRGENDELVHFLTDLSDHFSVSAAPSFLSEEPKAPAESDDRGFGDGPLPLPPGRVKASTIQDPALIVCRLFISAAPEVTPSEDAHPSR